MIFQEITPTNLPRAESQWQAGSCFILINRFYFGCWQYRFGHLGEKKSDDPTFCDPDVISGKYSEVFLLASKVQKALIPVPETAEWDVIKSALEPVFAPWGGMEEVRIDRTGYRDPPPQQFNPHIYKR